jgi:hypothetical protein
MKARKNTKPERTKREQNRTARERGKERESKREREQTFFPLWVSARER